ncbi:XcyI family restriction endonuclease [Guyparkeria hydrothermalis]|uniref:XcyI family restriction endonuclease n=1 Tax=Guyparkeria hydrothermalis TaxID=923 RepID=UPI0020213C98|nr:XcyI family restriction endonuclease [Guyparkeria hydrothermalis]MCL7751164.1 XcyI family restriction endonuclease [Guyparkeria hydrothermalis]
MTINIPPPELQIDFSFILGKMRKLYLQDALFEVVGSFTDDQFEKLEVELKAHAPGSGVQEVAKQGLRGEIFFATPIILKSSPYLIGYYRMLLGFSKKEFYTSSFGLTSFKSMEERGVVANSVESKIGDLCDQMNRSAGELIQGVGAERISKDLVDDLTIITLGPQLRGGRNNKKGQDGIAEVFREVHGIVEHAETSSGMTFIKLKNAAGRNVVIEFAADPDIVIREELRDDSFHNLIAIEVKAGQDRSNIHNRVGEAEKSHQKARAEGFSECWTIVNVPEMDLATAKKESPSTNRFFQLADIVRREGSEYEHFKDRVIGLTGIVAAG